ARATAPPKPAAPPEVSRALSSIAEPSRGRLVRTWVGTTRGENGKTRVTFVWEPIPPPPGVRRDTASSVTLTAMSPDGETYYQGSVPESSAGNGDPATAATGPRQVVFEAPPGRLQL